MLSFQRNLVINFDSTFRVEGDLDDKDCDLQSGKSVELLVIFHSLLSQRAFLSRANYFRSKKFLFSLFLTARILNSRMLNTDPFLFVHLF